MKVKVIAAMLALLSGGFAFSGHAEINLQKAIGAVVKTTKALTISDADMAQYVSQSVAQMDHQNKVMPENSQYSQRLRRLTANVKDADGIPLNFKIYDVSEVNAFACPDGSVRVYRGLMDCMNDEELMGVVGHEIGHVVKRHSKNALKQQLLTGAAIEAAGAASNTIATLSSSQLGAIGETLMNANYSRKQENQADDYGYEFLVANDLNPWGMVTAFEKLSSMEGSDAQSYIQKMFSSHPDTKKRIERMSKRAKKEGYQRP